MAEQSHKAKRAIWMLSIEQSAIMNAADLRYLEPNDEDVATITDRIRTSGVEIGPEDIAAWVDRIDQLERL